jgi:hypothetical protein
MKIDMHVKMDEDIEFPIEILLIGERGLTKVPDFIRKLKHLKVR